MNAPPDIRRPGYAPTRIMPQSYADVEEIAKKAIKAGLFRTADGTPPDVTEAQCVFAIMTGLDAGMTPAQSVQSIYVKDGKCNIVGQGCLALIRGAGCRVAQIDASEANDWTAACIIERPNGEVIERKYSKADAIRAGLWREEPDLTSVWYTAQVRMLWWRAVGRASVDGCSDILRGLQILEVTNDEERVRGERGASRQPARSQSQALDVPDNIDQDQAFLDNLIGSDSWDARKHLGDLKAALENVKTTPDLATIWDSHLQMSDGKLSATEAGEAETHYEAASNRLGG